MFKSKWIEAVIDSRLLPGEAHRQFQSHRCFAPRV